MVALACVPNHKSRIPGNNGEIRKISLNITVCCDNTAFTNARVGHDRGVWSNKGVFSNVDVPSDVPNHFFTGIGFSVQTNGLMA